MIRSPHRPTCYHAMLAWLTLVLAAGCDAGPQTGSPPGGPPPADPPAARVTVCTASRQDLITTEAVPGTVEPRLSAAIAARVSGRIETLPVVLGQTVKAGEVLARLDAAELQARVDQAAATLEQAREDWQRIATLFAQQAATRAEADAAQARLRVARGAAAEARALLADTVITAPFDGVITRKSAGVGDLAMPGRALLQLENPDALQLEAGVPGALIQHVRLGAELTVQADSLPDTLTGTVVEIAPAADPLSRTCLVKLRLPAASGLRAGQFARVSIPADPATGIWVPTGALVQRGQLELVFVASQGRAHLRLVTSGRRTPDEVELVSGVDPGEQIVTAGADGLVDGQPLAIQP